MNARPTLHCPRCRHDLTGLPQADAPDAAADTVLTCPECGSATTIYAAADATIPRRGWGYFVLWVAFVMGLLLLLVCGLAAVVFGVWSSLVGVGAGGGGP